MNKNIHGKWVSSFTKDIQNCNTLISRSVKISSKKVLQRLVHILGNHIASFPGSTLNC